MFHQEKKKKKKNLFLATLLCPLQLGSVELFIRWENVFCVWHLNTEQTFGHPNCCMYFAVVFFVPPTDPPATVLCRLQPYGTEPRQRDKHLSMTTRAPISIYLSACITARVLSPFFRLMWFSLAWAVMSPLYTICTAKNRGVALRQQIFFLQADWCGRLWSHSWQMISLHFLHSVCQAHWAAARRGEKKSGTY